VSKNKADAGTTGKMGEGSQRITTSRDSENNGLGSCKAHHVSSGSQEDCCVSAGKVGEGEGATEKSRLAGGLAQWKCTMFP
jgi:hypothetical protein